VAEGRLAGDPPPTSDDGLWRSVRALPAKQRAAVIHRFVFDLAYRDVGERMGISEEAARQNVSAGLRRLRMEVDR
jgi:DNA-directed RNA polymerase specialized sigma24 family protein